MSTDLLGVGVSDWKKVPGEVVEDLFDLWRTVYGKRRAVLSDDRRRKIAQAVCSHGVDVTREAILGCSYSSWHMGENPRRKKYNDISLILRNAEKIESFADLYVENFSGGGFLDE